MNGKIYVFSARWICVRIALFILIGVSAAMAQSRAIGVVPLTQSNPDGFSSQYKQSYGVFVGVDKFPADDKIVSLKYAAKDARAMRDCFVNELQYMPAENSRLLVTGATGRDLPSRDNILEAITLAAQQAGPAGCVVVHLSTHGYKGYVLAETSRRSILDFSAIPLAGIEKILAESRSPRRLLIFDACREVLSQGEKALGSGMSSDFAKAFQDSEGFAVLMSCDAGQFSYEAPEAQHGAFTYFLLQGLRGEAPANSEGLITVTSLSNWVQKSVEEWSLSKPAGKQSPRFDLRQATGDMPLVYSKGRLEAQKAKRAELAAAAKKLSEMFASGQLNAELHAKAQNALASQNEENRNVALDVAAGRLRPEYMSRLLASATAPTPTPKPIPASEALAINAAPPIRKTAAPTATATPKAVSSGFVGQWGFDLQRSRGTVSQAFRAFYSQALIAQGINPAYYDMTAELQTMENLILSSSMGALATISPSGDGKYVFHYVNPAQMEEWSVFAMLSPDGKQMSCTGMEGQIITMTLLSANALKASLYYNPNLAMAYFGAANNTGLRCDLYWLRKQ